MNITHEMKARQEFVDRNLNTSFRQLHEGFFTNDEIDQIIDGKDFWMDKDEVLQRWAARRSFIRPQRVIAEATITPKRGRPARS